MTPDLETIEAGLSDWAIATLMRLTERAQTARKGKFSAAAALTLALDGFAKIGEDETGWFDTYCITETGLQLRNHISRTRGEGE